MHPFARVFHIQTRPGKLEEAAALYQQAMVPFLAAQPGFGGTLLLTDPASGKALSVTLWESEADRMACERQPAFLAELGRVGPLLAEAPARESLVVSASCLGF